MKNENNYEAELKRIYAELKNVKKLANMEKDTLYLFPAFDSNGDALVRIKHTKVGMVRTQLYPVPDQNILKVPPEVIHHGEQVFVIVQTEESFAMYREAVSVLTLVPNQDDEAVYQEALKKATEGLPTAEKAMLMPPTPEPVVPGPPPLRECGTCGSEYLPIGEDKVCWGCGNTVR